MQALGGAVDYDEYRQRQRTASPAASAANGSIHTYTYVPHPTAPPSNEHPGAGTPGRPPPPPEQPQYLLVAGPPVAYCGYPQACLSQPRPAEPAPNPPGYYCVPTATSPRPPETSPATHTYYHYPAAQEPEHPPAVYVANNPNSHEHSWFGRTTAQVAEDNQITAEREGVYGRNAFVPKDPKDDQLFWVVEPDGKSTALRTFDTIENMGWEGEWKLDDRHGNLYFQRK